MDAAIIRTTALILEEQDIPICVTGDIVLNYYNVPRVCHVSHAPCQCRMMKATKQKNPN